MNPLGLLKHAGLDALEARLRTWKVWQLWGSLVALAGIDVLTAVVDFIPLIDDMLIGGLAIKVSAELLRRRNKARKADGEDTSPN